MTSLIGRSKALIREYLLYRPARAWRDQAAPAITAAQLIGEPPGPILLIAAHPDDEAIGGAILLSHSADAHVLHITNGAPRDGKAAQDAGFAAPADYARARHGEATAALGLVGAQLLDAPNLPVPDQEVIFNAAKIIGALKEIMGRYKVVITHAYEGGHPDHDATAFAVHAARSLLEHQGASPALFEMAGYHAWGGYPVFGTFIPHSPTGPIAELQLSAAERELKRRVFDCHATQKKVLTPFPIDVERFRAAPRYDFRYPPHRGRLLYDQFGWAIDRTQWTHAVTQSLREAGLGPGAI